MREWLVVAAAALGGCQTTARGEIYEEMIEQRLRELGREAVVDCPDRIPLGRVADNRFDCVVTEPGRRTEVVVRLGRTYDQWRLAAK